tara:strand:- start:857 stop:2119 length:1263 start_codon:yes stop_codon:yes gene_type:complete
MIVGIIGSGGREHAICQKIYRSRRTKKIYCFPGNGGTAEIAENINITSDNIAKLKKFIFKKKIDLVVVGPEQPLVDGIVDDLIKSNIKVFGPSKIASQLEGSKIFTKDLCKKYDIPTADFGVFKNKRDAINFIKKTKLPIVVKADGLAAGKGVYICENIKNAENSVNEIFDGKFGKAKNVLIEEFLQGEEMSYFIISDGKTFKKFQTAQDHKRVFEGDKGPNTGGMGCYSPSRLINKKMDKKILNRIIKPTLKALKDLGTGYQGFLYAGLMIVKNNPYLIEYNVRMGDPECQTILPLLKNDFLDLIDSCCKAKLSKTSIKWKDKKSLCIVLCSKGYPNNYRNKVKINNLNKNSLTKNVLLFHAGTKLIKNNFFSNGGRVLNFVSLSKKFDDSRKNIFRSIKKLNWINGFFRKDIGYKVIE